MQPIANQRIGRLARLCACLSVSALSGQMVAGRVGRKGGKKDWWNRRSGRGSPAESHTCMENLH